MISDGHSDSLNRECSSMELGLQVREENLNINGPAFLQ